MTTRPALNILYILPSRDWNNRERCAFRDMELAKEQGYNIILCTYEDSFLAKTVKNLGVEILPFKEHFLNRMLNFHRHFSLRPIFRRMNIDIVHCYELNLLLSISFQLKTELLTGLIVTQDHLIDSALKRFWYRPFISRIDLLIITNKNLQQDTLGNFGLALKKIEYFGMGLKVEDPLDPEQIAVNFDVYRDYFLVGTYISPEFSDLESFIPLLSSLKILNEKMPGGKKSKLVLFSVVHFQTIEILPEMMRMIEAQDLKDDILFVTTQDIVGITSYLDLWASNSAKELMEDFAISALMHEVPAIFVRNFCTKDLLTEFVGVGETYKLYDARELRDKWEKIILGNAVFKEKARLYKYFIEREHSFKSYKNQFSSIYVRTFQRRSRTLLRKTK